MLTTISSQGSKLNGLQGGSCVTVTVHTWVVLPSSAVTVYSKGALKSWAVPESGAIVAPGDSAMVGVSAVMIAPVFTSTSTVCATASIVAGPVCSVNSKETISVSGDWGAGRTSMAITMAFSTPLIKSIFSSPSATVTSIISM